MAPSHRSEQAREAAEEAERGMIGIFTAIYPRLVRAIEREYGPAALELATREFADAMMELSQASFPPADRRSLGDYQEWLRRAVPVGLEYEVQEETDSDLRFRFTACPWAQAFRAIGEPEIGHLFCDVDEPVAGEFNSAIRFSRTKTLMDGDDHCNHHYSIAKIEG